MSFLDGLIVFRYKSVDMPYPVISEYMKGCCFLTGSYHALNPPLCDPLVFWIPEFSSQSSANLILSL